MLDDARAELEPMRGVVEVRQSDLGWGRAIWRGDDQAVVSWNVLGRMGSDSPLPSLRPASPRGGDLHCSAGCEQRGWLP